MTTRTGTTRTETDHRDIGATDKAPRVAGSDESYLLAEDLFGASAPIQFSWVFDDDPGQGAVDELCRHLATGALHRAVQRTRVPAARHRWVRSPRTATVGTSETIPDDAIGEWVDSVLRGAALRPVDGAGWQLDTVTTTAGRRVVSLLLSHMIADGQGVFRALSAAASGTATSLPPAEGGWRSVREDIADAGRQLAAAARSLRVLVTQTIRQRRSTSAGASADGPDPDRRAQPADGRAGRPTGRAADVDATLAIVDVDSRTWKQHAAAHSGTSNGLFAALLAGIVTASEYPVNGPMRVCIAVNRREGESDDRANASGGVWIRLPEPVDGRYDLADIRMRSKAAFTAYAESGAEQVTDNLQPVVRLLPKRLVGKLIRAIPGPDTTVSNLGVAPDDALSIGGKTASSFAIRAMMLGGSAADRRGRGPGVAAWLVEYGDRMTLTFLGLDPDHFGDAEQLRVRIGNELSARDIDFTFW
ncbi:hypothetical protein [Millisia brevis]|uniref:hypothetical protein n=1 Tax=Millisia brevis TaxID=264148 RepID=UPI000B168136